MKKILVLFSLLCFPLTLQVQAAKLDIEQQEQIRELIRQTLIEQPDIIVDAINELRKQEFQKQQAEAEASLKANATALFENNKDPYQGSKNPKLTIAYFSDFNCGFCKRQDPILEKILETFPEVRIVYKDLPILGESSREASMLALAAHRHKAENYPPLHRKLMSKPGRHDSQSIAAAFKSEGLDTEKLKHNDQASISQQLDNNIKLATELGIRGTPAIVFPDEIIGGFVEEQQLSEMIRKRIKKS